MNYPAAVNNKSESNNDIIFYLCQELVDGCLDANSLVESLVMSAIKAVQTKTLSSQPNF